MAPGAEPDPSRGTRGGKLTLRRIAALLVAAAVLGCCIDGAAANAAPPRSLSLGFRSGLFGFNLSGVGDVAPRVVRLASGNRVCRFALDRGEGRSELSLGGDARRGDNDTIEFREGDEYWYGFSFNVRRMDWGDPTGAWNLIMQFKSDGRGSPAFGLDLWDYHGERGLWSEGSATGNRFLAPVGVRSWHRVLIHFRASERRRGFYRIYLDGRLVDRRDHVSMIVPGRDFAYLKNGLYRNGDELRGKSVLLLDSVELSASQPRASRLQIAATPAWATIPRPRGSRSPGPAVFSRRILR